VSATLSPHDPRLRPSQSLVPQASAASMIGPAFAPSSFTLPVRARNRSTRSHSRPTMSAAPPVPVRRVLLPLGDGSEEIEASCIADVLARAGANVTVASVTSSLSVRMSRGMTFTADTLLSASADSQSAPVYDMIALPGGMPGAERLRDSAPLAALLKAALADPTGPIIAAICAAPAVVLAHHDLLAGRTATCYPAPAFVDALGDSADKTGKDVVVSEDGRVITSKGPATAMVFALTLVEALYGAEVRAAIAADLLIS
jgi:protein deglycase